jgi:hypothetical protein
MMKLADEIDVLRSFKQGVSRQRAGTRLSSAQALIEPQKGLDPAGVHP